MKTWIVYILECSDKTYYCGITNDIEKRLKCHNEGVGAKYTRSRRPVKLLVYREVETKGDALRLEYKVKQLSRNKKIEYLHGCGVTDKH